ncbi:MAG: M48 family metalloprotease, partial [Planctomycetota bacterium]
PWMFEDIQFHVVASPTLNAFTTGGKHVYFYTKLIEEVDSEDALAAVVGHEFGHIVGRHVQGSMNRQMGVLAAAAGAGAIGAIVAEDGKRAQTAGIAAGATAGVGQLAGMKWGRDGEREADDLGYDFYVRAGYDPDKFDDFFRVLASKSQGGGGLQGYLSTHPQSADRVRAAERRAAQTSEEFYLRYQQSNIATPEQFKSIQDRAANYSQQAARQAQNSQSYAQVQALLAAFPSCIEAEEAEQASQSSLHPSHAHHLEVVAQHHHNCTHAGPCSSELATAATAATAN